MFHPAPPERTGKLKGTFFLNLAASRARLRLPRTVRLLIWGCQWLAIGAVLTALAYQLPARHRVQVGLNDAAYVQGFEDAANRWGVITDDTGVSHPYRWSRQESALIFPQIGLPARAMIRVRGWRPAGVPAPRVRVLLNGGEELGAFATSGEWEEHSFNVTSGLWKPRDVFLQLEVEPALERDGARYGVQVDRVVFETMGGPIIPYPAQLAGGAVAVLLAALSFPRDGRLQIALAVGLAALFLVAYRLQLTPYPVRLFWPITIGLLAVALLARHAHRVAQPRLVDGLAGAVLVGWGAATWRAARAHVVLSVPGVEKDFRVFATRSEALLCSPGATLADAPCVMRADGFYQLGYPFLLWLARPLAADNAFLAARVVAFASGLALLAAVYLLGRSLLGAHLGLLALLFVALNRWTAELSLSLGTDMPFAALWTAGLAAAIAARRSYAAAFLAGLLGGLTFLMRHPGILLLPIGCLALLWEGRPGGGAGSESVRRRGLLVATLVLGFLAASLPQLAVNVAQTGRPLYSEQAKNIWLAVYGNTDWGRWGEAGNDISLLEVIAHDPWRFVSNWWSNMRGFLGTGSEDTSELGRALGARLLSFPANLLGLAGCVLWLARGGRRERLLLLASLLYLAGIGVGFVLPRFVLPLVPLLALAAAAAAHVLWTFATRRAPHTPAVPRLAVWGGAAMLLLLLGTPRAGTRAVLNNQDQEAVAAVQLVAQTVAGTDRLQARLSPEESLHKYSAIAHLVVPEREAARYVLQTDGESSQGEAGRELIGRAGRFSLYYSNQ